MSPRAASAAPCAAADVVDQRALDGAGVHARLEDSAVLRVRGSAGRAFLGRQLTCDIAALGPGNALLGAWCSPKGRVLALARVVERVDEIALVLAADLATDTAERLSRFVLREDVAIELAPDLAVLGCAGGAAARVPPAAASAIAVEGGPARTLLIGDPDELDAHARAVAGAGSVAVTAAAWRVLDVRAGIPRIDAATRDEFVPQMINLDRVGAVSFTKGCYPGQEIVARTQHLGRIKRRTFLARTAAVEPEAVAMAALYCGDEPAGRVLCAARSPHGQEMLAVLALDALGTGAPVHLDAPAGPRLEIIPPPYGLGD